MPRLPTTHRLAAAALVCLAAAAPAAGQVQPVTVRAVAYFDFDRKAVRPSDEPNLLAEVVKMQNVTWQSITAVGHTDDVGPDGYNRRLSVQRAQAVKAWLVAKGLDASMIKVAGEGEATPLVPNENDEARAKNRRTELTFQGVRAQ